MKKKAKPEDNLRLFLQLCSDFKNYKSSKKQSDKLLSIQPSLKQVLNTIILSPKFTAFLINNEEIKSEQRKKEKAKKLLQKQQGIVIHTTPEDEAFTSNEQLIKYHSAQNTTCFGQRSIKTVQTFYNSINEMHLLKNEICYTMFKIEKEAFYTCDNIVSYNNNIHNEINYVLINKNNCKWNNHDDKVLMNTMPNNDGLTLKRDFNLNSLNSKGEMTQYEMLIGMLRKKKKYQIINASANEGKETTVTSKYSETKQGDVKRKIVKLPWVINMNKDVQYQVNRAKRKVEKDVIPLKSKKFNYVNDYDYNVVFNYAVATKRK